MNLAIYTPVATYAVRVYSVKQGYGSTNMGYNQTDYAMQAVNNS